MNIPYAKYVALGNVYIVVDPRISQSDMTSALVRDICRAAVCDGLLFGPTFTASGIPTVRIFNPDGSEAEKSGNGIRIFAKYLYDRGDINKDVFSLSTKGGLVAVKRNRPDATNLSIEIGKLSLMGTHPLLLDGRDMTGYAADIGNPHCVLILDHVSEAFARTLGPLVETNPLFPNRTNVQFVEVVDRAHIKLFIWERRAGYTLSSGTSSAAAAGVCHHLGLCDRKIQVQMPGGAIDVFIGDHFDIEITGDVQFLEKGAIDVQLDKRRA